MIELLTHGISEDSALADLKERVERLEIVLDIAWKELIRQSSV